MHDTDTPFAKFSLIVSCLPIFPACDVGSHVDNVLHGGAVPLRRKAGTPGSRHVSCLCDSRLPIYRGLRNLNG